MIKNNKLLIDRDCPMCNIYGKCFTKMGWIDKNTVDNYQDISDTYSKEINMNRAKNEIALFNTENSKTIYGIDAMIRIASHDKPLLASFLNSVFIYPLLKLLYSFISYNRKVIVPSNTNVEGRDCTPDLKLGYRWTYIIFVAMFTGVILNQFAYHINLFFGLEHDWKRELYICFGQIAWQMIAIYILQKKSMMDYLGNMSTVSMIGGILLIPILLFNAFIGMHTYALIISFFAVVGVMFFEHIRRCKLLGVSLWMTFSWVMFRTVVLIVIIGLLYLSF